MNEAKCPKCGGAMRVIESRGGVESHIRYKNFVMENNLADVIKIRVRRCVSCGHKILTTESYCVHSIEDMPAF